MNLSSTKDLDILQQIAAYPDQVFFIYNIGLKKIEYINSAYSHLFEKNPAIINDDLFSLLAIIYPDDRQFVEQQYYQLTNNFERKSIEFRIVLPNNSIKWISLHAYLIMKRKKKQAIAGFVEDITTEKENEENASKFSMKKNSILEILAHDLTGPIGVMQNIASLIKEQAKDNPRINEYTMLIEQICKRNIDMIRNLIQTEYLASSEIEVTLERIDLVYKISLIIGEYRRSEDKLGKTFTLTSSSEKIFVEVDEIKFSQVINNLIGNAIKFTPDGGIISINIEDQPHAVLISLKDNGIGIPQHVQPFLFDRFTKARRQGLKGEETTGLGMSITKKMVELHRGKIWFESKENQGTTFFIEIPRINVKQPE